MRRSHVYKWIAVCCFLLFLVLQYLMIARSYDIKRSQLFQKEKREIRAVYNRHILNDKIYPGGQKLIDTALIPHMNRLKYRYEENTIAFYALRDSLSEQLCAKLRSESTMDSLFQVIQSEVGLGEGFGYSLVLKEVSITFDARTFIPIIDFAEDQFLLIGGDPQFIEAENLVSSIAVAANSKMSNRVAFALFVGNTHTVLSVLKAIFPLLLLSGCCITGIIGLYWGTYRNWMKQKRMAEMASDFINNVTHEFNTPLTTIRIALSNIAAKVSKEEKLKISATLDTMGRQIKRLDRLVNKAIDLSIFNQEQIIFEECSLVELLGQLKQDLAVLIHENTNIHITTATVGQDVKVLVNPFLFVTMINNLVDNGLKYNNARYKEIDIHLGYAANNGLVLAVQDNGIGISDSQLPHIFTKGYRGKRYARSTGLGLGLFFVMEVVRIHRWHIEVKSDEQRGTTFFIFMPIIN